jgi:hypothetical protein
MPPLMSAEINKKDIEELLKTYSPNLMRKAARSALDRTGTWAKKYLANDVASNYNISPSAIRNQIKVTRTTQNDFSVSILIKAKLISLFSFGAYQDNVGVKANVSKTKQYSYPHAFINIARKGGGRFIAKRKGKTKYQVTGKGMRGVTIPMLINMISKRDKRDSDMTDHLYKELQEQITKRTLGIAQTPGLE